MRVIARAVDALGLAHEVRAPDIADLERCQEDALGVAQGNRVTFADAVRKRLADVQRYRQRPENAALEAHRITDALVIRLAEEALERRKRAVHEHIEIADLSLRQIQGSVVLGPDLFLVGFPLRQVELVQPAAVCFLKCAHRLPFLSITGPCTCVPGQRRPRRCRER